MPWSRVSSLLPSSTCNTRSINIPSVLMRITRRVWHFPHLPFFMLVDFHRIPTYSSPFYAPRVHAFIFIAHMVQHFPHYGFFLCPSILIEFRLSILSQLTALWQTRAAVIAVYYDPAFADRYCCLGNYIFVASPPIS